jgi:dTDP-4-dehydrorhamnose reductase
MGKVAVTGPRGRLGRELVKWGCMPLTANVTDYHALQREISYLNPDIIIHCAAYTNVDGCENAPRRAADVNTYGTYNLRQAFSGKIVYLSTDYIFDGLTGMYKEDDKPNPLNIYGWSKLGGELTLSNDDLIIRTTVLFDKGDNNFVTQVINQLLCGNTVKAPDTLFGSPTYVPHLAEGILAALHLRGALNIAGNRIMSRYRLAQFIAEILGFGQVEKAPYTSKTRRPMNAGLDVGKAQMLGLPIYDALEGIKELCPGNSGSPATKLQLTV